MKNNIRSSAQVHPSARLENPVKIYSHVDISANTRIGKYTYIRPYTYTSKGVRIGRFCSIGDYCIIGASKHPVDWVTTHTFAYDTDTKFNGSPLYNLIEPETYSVEKNNTIIGSDVWIGSRAIIMSGVSVGHGAVIGAGAIISKNVPAYSIVVGANHILRYRFERKNIKELRETKWWELSEESIAGMKKFSDVEHCITYLKNERQKLTPKVETNNLN
jgi:acetyltransferase-like isoleucine patch superfamily enzyme